MSHVDSHHNAHLLPEIFSAVVRIAAQHNVIKMRFYRAFYEAESSIYETHCQQLNDQGFKTVAQFRDFGQPEAIFNLNSETTELMAHLDKPGHGGKGWCETQFVRLMSAETQDILAGQMAQISSYHAV